MAQRRLSRRALVALRLLRSTGERLLRGDLATSDLFSWARWLHVRRRLPKPRECGTDPSDQTRLLDVGGVRVWWPAEYPSTDLDLVWGEVFRAYPPNGHAYEFGPCRVSHGDWVLDAGACEGFFVAYALRKGCKVLAVEPVPRLSYCLEKTFRREVATGLVVVANVLLGSAPGVGHMQILGSPIGAHRSAAGDVAIPVRTVDGLLDEAQAPRIDFIKMDIEGSEPDALAGGLGTLRRFQPRLAIAVYHSPSEEADVRAVLGGSGVTFDICTKGLFRIGGRLVRQVLHAVPAPA